MQIFLKIIFVCVLSQQIQCSSVLHTLDQAKGDLRISYGDSTAIANSNLTCYMVSVRSKRPIKYFGDNHFCSGVIIASNVVLTAAHCVTDKRKVVSRPRRLLIVAGTPHRLQRDNSTMEFNVKNLAIHPDFKIHNSHDIGLIFIEGKFPDVNPFIKVMPLPTEMFLGNQKCVTLGWGRMYYKGPLPDATQFIDIMVYDLDECQRLLKHNRCVINGTICGGESPSYKEQPCHGDGGGPLVCKGKLVGIVSHNYGCGRFQIPSLYTDVYYHLSWIEDTLNDGHHIRPKHYVLQYLTLYWLLSCSIKTNK